jgi:hypothetical protein
VNVETEIFFYSPPKPFHNSYTHKEKVSSKSYISSADISLLSQRFRKRSNSILHLICQSVSEIGHNPRRKWMYLSCLE